MNNSSLWIVLQRMRLPFTVIAITYAIAMTGLVIIPGVDDQGNPYSLTIFDAFYFITYTATTIGFGELPYPLVHAQKIWVTFSIYITVLGWFYGIGTLVSLLQDKLFLSQIAISKFKRAVNHIKSDFVIVLGYNDTTSEIIKTMLDSKTRVVVIEKEQSRADILKLEGFIPDVPVLVSDVHNPISLEYAGIKSINCKGVISLFESNILNLRVTLASKLLNPLIKVAVKATTSGQTGNLLDAGADVVENPFAIIAYQIHMGLNTPSIFKLENWLYQIDTLEAKTFKIPKSNIIICGYGRLGKSINNIFKKNNIEPTIIEIKPNIYEEALTDGIKNIIHGNAEDKYILKQANIDQAKLVIVVTNHDTINLSIVSTIKKLNKNSYIIARENELSDFSIFSHSKIDKIFLPDQILIHKTTNAIKKPLCDRMIRLMIKQNESWGASLLYKLMKNIHRNPDICEITINKDDAFEVYKYLENPEHIFKLDYLRRSRRDRNQYNNIVPLLIVRGNDDILLPKFDIELKIDDNILIACDQNAKDDIEYIANNVYEFHYVVTGSERKYLTKFISRT